MPRGICCLTIVQLPEDTRRAVVSYGEAVVLKDGQTIVKQWSNNSQTVVKSGRRPHPLGGLRRGSCCGEFATFGRWRICSLCIAENCGNGPRKFKITVVPELIHIHNRHSGMGLSGEHRFPSGKLLNNP